MWFGNVEHAVAADVGRETVQYVSHISKYYTAYSLAVKGAAVRGQATEALEKAVE